MNLNDMKSWQKIELKAGGKIRTDAARLSVAKNICSFNPAASVLIRKIAESNDFDIYRDPITGKIHLIGGGDSMRIRKTGKSADGIPKFAIFAPLVVGFFNAEGYKTYSVEANDEDKDITLIPIGEKVLKGAHS